jgi:tetratricopeptide (TPR) repeat protein
MMRGRPAAVVCALAVLLPSPWSATPARARDLRGVEALTRAYDDILDARFDHVEADLQRACGPAPREACDVLNATAIWWHILLDPEDRSLDEAFTEAVERAIRATDAWTTREPSSAEAWFYSGAAYAARVQWRVARNQKVAAARDGKRIKQALEQALALDPGLEDANFGIGMYEYYADVAPAAARVLRFLLLLPGGDKVDGLARMLKARNRGRLLQGEADYQLHIIYLWYERRTDQAIALLQALHERYPGNPLFLAQLAEIRDTYQHDLTASLDTWRTLLAAARDQRVNEPQLAEAKARLGMARMLDALDQTDRAIEQLQALIDLKPEQPAGALAAAWLALGQAQDRLGRRDEAVVAYRAALAADGGETRGVRAAATERLRRAPDPVRASAYRLSLEGWRRLERNDPATAETLLARAVSLYDRDPVAHYRYGRVLQARKDVAAALTQYEVAIRGARECPPPIAAAAYLEAARLYERAGRRDRAIAAYRAASTWFGAAADTRAAAMRALARLHAQ